MPKGPSWEVIFSEKLLGYVVFSSERELAWRHLWSSFQKIVQKPLDLFDLAFQFLEPLEDLGEFAHRHLTILFGLDNS